MTLACGFAVMLVLILVYAAVMWLLFRALSKRSCLWFNQAARTKRHYEKSAGDCRRFTFENPAYADRFVEANSPARSQG